MGGAETTRGALGAAAFQRSERGTGTTTASAFDMAIGGE
jgi:hypothetical protein